MDNIPIRQIQTVEKPSLLGRFNIRDIQELLGGNDLVQGLHRHNFFLLVFLKKGLGRHEIDFTSYPVWDHSLFLLRPGQVHQLVLEAGSAGYLIQFDGDFCYSQNKSSQQLLRKASSRNYCGLGVEGFGKLDSILGFVLKEFAEKQEGFEEVIKSSLSIFFIELLRQRQTTEVSAADASAYTQEQLERFLELLERHISENKQVSEYADMLNLSTYQLNAITKTSLNKTASELINGQLVLESKRQLLATSNQVNQIAYQLGYEDVSYFIRFFKKQTGSSPEAFRNNFK